MMVRGSGISSWTKCNAVQGYWRFGVSEGVMILKYRVSKERN